MSDKRLLPCPFCGSEATFSNDMDNTSARIRCTKCRCKMEVFGESAFERAREEWNTRKPMERIVEKLEGELNDSVTKYEKTLEEEYQGQADAFDIAIKIIKEEGGV